VNYQTACIGKWHLGHLPQYLPTNNGFDYYFGIPYSNDMDRVQLEGLTGREANTHPKVEYFNVPLMQNEQIIERPADQTTITKRYTDETIKFITENKDKPFFIYLAHNLPHIPLFRSVEFEGKSKRGIYGDVIEEIDSGIGRIFTSLRENGLEENTLVVFTTDNGPWLVYNSHGGSAGLLRDGKGSTFEGGMRVPTIFSWKGNIKPAVVNDMGSTLDLFPTICKLTGADYPHDRVMDGYDLSETLLNEVESPRKSMVYYWGEEIYAYRSGAYKAHFKTRERVYINREVETHETPLLYNLEVDPSEKYDISETNTEIIAGILNEVEKHRASVDSVENQLMKTKRLE
ncbi:MAG: sulfatase-like hydrolase/transferase, partial [Cyclobacteriaceae bacterium]|nr:sulfatase-like hydrolase/transferase [Cyclobacteriaceae bacterium]